MDKDEIITDWFHQYSDEIFNFLIYRIGHADVDDLVQEVFIRAINGFEQFKGESKPKTWLYSIARNIAIDEIRRRNRKKSKSLVSLETSEELSTDITPELILGLKEENKELYEAIQSLKSNYRDVIILRGIRGISVKETSEILSWNEKKTRLTYYRAKLALQKRLGGMSDEQ